MQEENENKEVISFLFRSVCRKKKLAFGFAVVLISLLAIAEKNTIHEYTCETQIYINGAELIQELISHNTPDRLKNNSLSSWADKIIKSDKNITKVTNECNLKYNLKEQLTPIETVILQLIDATTHPSKKLTDEERITKKIREKISITSENSSITIKTTWRDSDDALCITSKSAENLRKIPHRIASDQINQSIKILNENIENINEEIHKTEGEIRVLSRHRGDDNNSYTVKREHLMEKMRIIDEKIKNQQNEHEKESYKSMGELIKLQSSLEPEHPEVKSASRKHQKIKSIESEINELSKDRLKTEIEISKIKVHEDRLEKDRNEMDITIDNKTKQLHQKIEEKAITQRKIAESIKQLKAQDESQTSGFIEIISPRRPKKSSRKRGNQILILIFVICTATFIIICAASEYLNPMIIDPWIAKKIHQTNNVIELSKKDITNIEV